MQIKSEEAKHTTQLVTSLPPPTVIRRFPESLLDELTIVQSQHGIGYVVMADHGNTYALPIGSRELNNLIMDVALSRERPLRRRDLNDINSMIQSFAETKAEQREVWYRVASIDGGIEIDPGYESHIRYRITGDGVDVIESGSTTLFYRHQNMLPMAMPAKGDE
jgi:hypothetical protein